MLHAQTWEGTVRSQLLDAHASAIQCLALSAMVWLQCCKHWRSDSLKGCLTCWRRRVVYRAAWITWFCMFSSDLIGLEGVTWYDVLPVTSPFRIVSMLKSVQPSAARWHPFCMFSSDLIGLECVTWFDVLPVTSPGVASVTSPCDVTPEVPPSDARWPVTSTVTCQSITLTWI